MKEGGNFSHPKSIETWLIDMVSSSLERIEYAVCSFYQKSNVDDDDVTTEIYICSLKNVLIKSDDVIQLSNYKSFEYFTYEYKATVKNRL